MAYLLNTWSLRRELLSGRLDSHRLPALAAKHGFAGIEWLDRLLPSYHREVWQKLAQAQEKAGLTRAALGISLEMGARPTYVAEQVDRAKQVLGRAKILGVDTVRVSLGGGDGFSLGKALSLSEQVRSRANRDQTPLGPLSRLAYRAALALEGVKKRPLPPRAEPMLLQKAAWLLEPLAKQARRLGLKLGLENHFGCTSHPEDVLAICELVGNNLGVCLDLGNFCRGQDQLAACRLLAPRAVLVHFKTYQAKFAAIAGQEGYPAKLAILREAGYAGDYSLEYQGRGNGLAGAGAALEWLRRLE